MSEEQPEINQYFKNYNCWINNNILRFDNLIKPRLVPEFINSIKRLVYKFNHKEIILDFNNVDKIFPFPLVPISAYIRYFIEKENISFDYKISSAYLENTNFKNPQKPSKKLVNRYTNALDKIWIFTNSEEINLLVNGIKSSIRKSVVCEQGIFDAIDWGLNEVMDNVIQHADSDKGFLMAQLHKQTKSLNVCIFDYGQGIFNTLKNTKYKPKNAIDAISLCVKEGVTRDKKIGQGNGLWGLYNMITLNGGHLTIISGKGGLNFNKKDNSIYTFKDIILLNKKNQSTNVNFHLNLDKNISIKDALKGHKIIDLFLENFEDDYGKYVYKISKAAYGTGTRQAAIAVKNEILNIQKQVQLPIVIDFNNVGIITSSFADELIAKLLVDVGFFQFQKMFRLKNMNVTIQSILHHSIGMRVAEVFCKENK